MSQRVKRVVGGAVAALALTLVGGAVWAAVGHGSRRPPTPVMPQPSPVVATYASTVGKIAPAADLPAAVRAALNGLDRGDFVKVSFDKPPAFDNRPGWWMYATVKGTSTSKGEYLSAVWEAELAQGGVADRLAGGKSNLADVIVGSSIWVDTGGGHKPEVLGGGAGDVAAGQIFGSQASDESDASIRKRVKMTLRAYGLRPKRVRVLHPLGPAVYATATVNDPTILRGKWTALGISLDANAAYEGIYLEIDKPDGTPLVRASHAYRTGSSSVWFAPGYDELLGINHGGPVRN
ncbi:MAG: hypothetical protein JWR35_456 [Marmoricola sp.]|jgi:hypothetical protein|nr:hypothetical protein [Marmoricola sp.]